MRRWLVEETDEVRFPKVGDNYLCGNTVCFCSGDSYEYFQFPILKVTELPDCPKITELPDWAFPSQIIEYSMHRKYCIERTNIPLTDRFDEWNW